MIEMSTRARRELLLHIDPRIARDAPRVNRRVRFPRRRSEGARREKQRRVEKRRASITGSPDIGAYRARGEGRGLHDAVHCATTCVICGR